MIARMALVQGLEIQVSCLRVLNTKYWVLQGTLRMLLGSLRETFRVKGLRQGIMGSSMGLMVLECRCFQLPEPCATAGLSGTAEPR